MPAEETTKGKRALLVAATAAVLLVLFVAAIVIDSEQDEESGTATTTELEMQLVDTSSLLGSNDYDVIVSDAGLSDDLAVLSILPTEVEDEGFTYYDLSVQERLAQTVSVLASGGDTLDEWTFDAPLAIINPYGTGSNGLYLCFDSEFEGQLSYLIQTEDYDDYEATATGGYTLSHEIQIIGLVPGESNHVTLTLADEAGTTIQIVEFDITMPETLSGYPVQIEYEDGESTTELSNGLYAIMRTSGYSGYGYFFDNSGTLRYEMVIEGTGMERLVEYEGDIVTGVSSNKVARINGLGQVVGVYATEEFTLHHDINDAQDGKFVLCAQYTEAEDNLTEDLIVELDLETGEFSLLLDFSEFMEDYRTEYTRVITEDDFMSYEAGVWDWIHINSVQYMEDGDSLIVSSRETSTIIKVENIHSEPTIAWMCGNSAFWDGTAYEDLTLAAVGDFKYQYGQHSVEYAGAGEEDGVYYLRMYDNNLWALSTRDDYEMAEEDLADVGDTIYSPCEASSYVYVYKIDENAGTFELVFSIEVPYSAIVSSATPSDTWLSYRVENQDELYDMTGKTWIVCSGVANLFGEYDENGVLIRQFSYESSLQGYRVIKYTLEGFWFAGE